MNQDVIAKLQLIEKQLENISQALKGLELLNTMLLEELKRDERKPQSERT